MPRILLSFAMAWAALTLLAATGPVAAQTTPPPATTSDTAGDTTDAARGTFTDGAAATDHAGHTMSYSDREPDTDRKPRDDNKQVNITGVVEARMPDSQVVCKYSPIIGSRLSTKLCLPLYRWKQMHQDAQQMIRDGQAASNYGGVHPF